MTFVVGLWIVFSVLHSSLSSTLNQQTVLDTQPISGSFDTKTLNTLKEREVVNPQSMLPLTPTPTPTPTAAPTPASALQILTVPLNTSSRTASQGGTLP